jgi:hypothetical protein
MERVSGAGARGGGNFGERRGRDGWGGPVPRSTGWRAAPICPGCVPTAATALPAPSLPPSLSPQHTVAPPCSSAQAWLSPAEMLSAVRSAAAAPRLWAGGSWCVLARGVLQARQRLRLWPRLRARMLQPLRFAGALVLRPGGRELTVEIDRPERRPHARRAGPRRRKAADAELALPVPPPADYVAAVDEGAGVLVAGRQRHWGAICAQTVW